MSTRLVYHREKDEVSPFDKVAIKIARHSDLRIACPYLSLNYLKRLIEQSNSWKLLTDIEDWFASQKRTERKQVVQFIARNSENIRHSQNLHAKVLIGNRAALVGSANLTTSGIQCRTEMGVYLRDSKLTNQLSNWFSRTWKTSCEVPANTIKALVESLPEPHKKTHAPGLVSEMNRRLVPLVNIDKKVEGEISPVDSFRHLPVEVNNETKILRYKRAKGCMKDGTFYVLQGSIASGSASATFETLVGGRYKRLRDSLIAKGILVKAINDWNYTFSADFPFNSRSEAAYVVDGNSRSGAVWK